MKRFAIAGLFVAAFLALTAQQHETRSYAVSTGTPIPGTRTTIEQIVEANVWPPLVEILQPKADRARSYFKTPAYEPLLLFPAEYSHVVEPPVQQEVDLPSTVLVAILHKVNIWHQPPDEDEHRA